MLDQKTANNTALLQAMEEIQEICYEALDNEVMKDDSEKFDGLEAISFLSQKIYEYRKTIKVENLEYRYERSTKKMLGIIEKPSCKSELDDSSTPELRDVIRKGEEI